MVGQNKVGQLVCGLVVVAAGCAEQVTPATSSVESALTRDCSKSARYEQGDVGGAAVNFGTVDTSILPMWMVGKTLANDQIHMLRMADNAGLNVHNKHIPAFPLFDGMGNVTAILAGGFYQCERYEDCKGYIDQVVPNYRIDGVKFADRPEFHGSFEFHAYQVIGSAKFADIPSDYAIKVTRWSVDAGVNPIPALNQAWKAARVEACNRSTVTQAHLLWNPTERVVAEVTIGAKVDPPPGDPSPYFFSTIGALAGQPVLNPSFDQTSTMHRIAPPITDTYLVITYWPGAFEPSYWPNSASVTPGGPMPEPFCGDGSCNTTTSHVETAASCPADCPASCGNGTCDGGEGTMSCAVDCPP